MNSADLTDLALVLVRAERARHDARWGVARSLHPHGWLAMLAEEFGEVAKVAIDPLDQDAAERLATELAHVAAVAVAWIEAMARPAMPGAR